MHRGLYEASLRPACWCSPRCTHRCCCSHVCYCCCCCQLLLLHSEKLVPDGQESLARGVASPDLSASAHEVVAEFVYAGRHNPPGTPSAGPLVGHHSLAWRPLDELLSLEGLLVGLLVHQERRGLAARAPRHSGPARLAAAANIVVSPGFSTFSIFFVISSLIFISSYHMAYMSYIICRISYGYIRSTKHRMS